MPILGVWLFFQPKIDGFIGFEVLLDFSSDRQMTPKNLCTFWHASFYTPEWRIFWYYYSSTSDHYGFGVVARLGKPDVEGAIINAHETRVTKP